MAKLSKKTLVIGAGGAVLVGGVVATAVALTQTNPETAPKQTSTSKNTTTAATAEPTNPGTILKSIDTYADKDLSVTGTVIQLEGSNYYVVSQEKDVSGAILLDFSKSGLNPANYSYAPPSSDSGQKVVPKGPFVVTGKLSKPDENHKAPTLIVQTVKEAQ